MVGGEAPRESVEWALRVWEEQEAAGARSSAHSRRDPAVGEEDGGKQGVSEGERKERLRKCAYALEVLFAVLREVFPVPEERGTRCGRW